MKRGNLKALRMSKGITQSDVSAATGISRGYYSDIENGKRNCSVEKWGRIGKFLNIPNSDLASYMFEEGGTENVKEDHMQDGSGCNGDSRANAESCAAGRCV